MTDTIVSWFVKSAKLCADALFGTRKPPQQPDYDHRWDALAVKDLVFPINCLLPEHERMTLNGIKKRQSGPENGGTKATPLQSWAMSWVLKDTRAGAAYDLRNGMYIFAEKYFMAVIEDNKKARILAQPGWWWTRNLGYVALSVTFLIALFRLWGPAFDLFVYTERDTVIEHVVDMSRELADTRVQLQMTINELDKSNDRVDRLEKQLGIFDGK